LVVTPSGAIRDGLAIAGELQAITMTLFFVVGISLFTAGFVIYVGTVIADLRCQGP
jgi:hypothetical protein